MKFYQDLPAETVHRLVSNWNSLPTILDAQYSLYKIPVASTMWNMFPKRFYTWRVLLPTVGRSLIQAGKWAEAISRSSFHV